MCFSTTASFTNSAAIAVVGVAYVKHDAFTSVWCAYAAVISILIYGHFHRRRAANIHGEILEH